LTTWATFRSDLKTQIATLIPAPNQVIWRDQVNPFQTPGGVLCRLHLLTSVRLSPWEDRRKVAQPDLTVTESTYSWRLVSVSAQFEGFNQADSGVALNVAEKVRRGLKSLDEEIALVDTSDIVDLSDVVDDRARSVAQMDLRFHVMITDTPETGIGTIGQIELTAIVKGPDGINLPSPPNYVDKVIPPP